MIRLIRVDGLSDLLPALAELPKATSANVLKRAMIKAAAPVVDAAQAKAPTMTFTLQESIKASDKLHRKVRQGMTKGSKVEVYIGAGPLVQATKQEFGTIYQRPQPFMRPAWASNWRKVLETIRDDIKTEIEKAAARLARKAAKRVSR